MSDLNRRIQKLEAALKPRSKGHRIVICVRGAGYSPRPYALTEEQAEQEVARLEAKGYEVDMICFVSGDDSSNEG